MSLRVVPSRSHANSSDSPGNINIYLCLTALSINTDTSDVCPSAPSGRGGGRRRWWPSASSSWDSAGDSATSPTETIQYNTSIQRCGCRDGLFGFHQLGRRHECNSKSSVDRCKRKQKITTERCSRELETQRRRTQRLLSGGGVS